MYAKDVCNSFLACINPSSPSGGFAKNDCIACSSSMNEATFLAGDAAGGEGDTGPLFGDHLIY